MATKNEKQHYIAGQMHLANELADMLTKGNGETVTLSRYWIKDKLIELASEMLHQDDDVQS